MQLMDACCEFFSWPGRGERDPENEVGPKLVSCVLNLRHRSAFLPPQGFGPEAKTRGGIIVVRAYIQYILVMQRVRVVYYGISHESLVFSRYTHEPLGECVYEENTSDSWDIP